MSLIEKVFVINLERSPERLKKVTENLTREGLSFERIPAVDGGNVTKRVRRENATFLCANFCTNGQFGCGVSHMNVWRRMVRDGIGSALILEDDARIVDGFRAKMDALWAEIPNDFDIVYVGCLVGCDAMGNDSLLSNLFTGLAPTTQLGNVWKRVSKHVFVPKLALGTHCYIVSQKGVRKLLASTDGKVNGHIDFQIQGHANKLKMYALQPKLAFQVQKQSISTVAIDAFPFLPMQLFDRMEINETLSLAYFLSCPALQIGSYPVNALTFTFLGLGLYFTQQPRQLPMFLKVASIIAIPDAIIPDHMISLLVSALLITGPTYLLRGRIFI